MAWLNLIMIITANGWSNMIYDYQFMFGNETTVSFFICSFWAIVKLIILSLLTGLIWEVFTIITETLDNIQNGQSIEGNFEIEKNSGDGLVDFVDVFNIKDSGKKNNYESDIEYIRDRLFRTVYVGSSDDGGPHVYIHFIDRILI